MRVTYSQEEEHKIVSKIQQFLADAKKDLERVQDSKNYIREDWMFNESMLKNKIAFYESLLQT